MTTYSTLNFGLGETLTMLQQQVQQFACKEITPWHRKPTRRTPSLTPYGNVSATWVC